MWRFRGGERPARRRAAGRGRLGFGEEHLAGLFRGAGGVLADEVEEAGDVLAMTFTRLATVSADLPAPAPLPRRRAIAEAAIGQHIGKRKGYPYAGLWLGLLLGGADWSSYTPVSPSPLGPARPGPRRPFFCGTMPRVAPGRRDRPRRHLARASHCHYQRRRHEITNCGCLASRLPGGVAVARPATGGGTAGERLGTSPVAWTARYTMRA